METKDFALHVKDVSDEGTFEGYASVAGNVDSYGDRVEPGAFGESLAKHQREGTKPLLLWQHNPDEPIGVGKASLRTARASSARRGCSRAFAAPTRRTSCLRRGHSRHQHRLPGREVRA
jgi:phage head maturation protease